LSLPFDTLRIPAAWYFTFIVYGFFALRGEKTIHKELNMTSKRIVPNHLRWACCST